MYYLIINNEIAAENTDFDVLQDRADAEMEGFVVSAEEWNAR